MVKRQKIHYYVNEDPGSDKYGQEDPALGIVIDWKWVRKQYDDLNMPKIYHDPLKPDFDRFGYSIDMSDRSRGKTTNKLIVGLILFAGYGIITHYLRRNSQQCELKEIRALYDTVISCGYIEQITGGKYNMIGYRGKRWYLQLVDEAGTVVEQCPQHCTICFGLDESDALKSIYNCPTGDWIYYDEFIQTIQGYNDFIWFQDLCKTIIRDRLGSVINLSANTINKHHQFFDEFGIRDEIESLKFGEHMEIATDLGTHIYIEIISPNTSETRQRVNRRFFGFRNSRTSSITGRGEWATETFQHIPKTPPATKPQPRVMINTVFLERHGRIVKLQLVNHPDLGVSVFAMPATKLYDDSIIFTADDLKDRRYVFGFGRSTPLEVFWTLYAQNRWWYASNGLGSLVKSYVSYTNTKIKSMRGTV